MAENSAISWTKSTFNPWIGCTKIGPGCDACYAAALDNRHRWKGATHWGAGVPRMRTSIQNWNKVLKWNREAPESEFAGRQGFWPVFCASLADVFDNEVDPQWRIDLWRLIAVTPNLSWLLVTKRIGNVRDMLPLEWQHCGVPPWVRIIITVVNQEEADRDIPKLLALKCKNGISYEPALGPIDFSRRIPFADGDPRHRRHALTGEAWLHGTDYGGHRDIVVKTEPAFRRLEWIIIGGESMQSGHQTRTFDVAWARSTIEQCRAAQVPVFVKQLGSRCYAEDPRSRRNLPFSYAPMLSDDESGQSWIRLNDRAGANPAEWPDLRVQEFPL